MIEKLKKEVVFDIAFIIAIISCFLIKPNKGYIEYIDYKVIGLLFCLMSVVAGLTEVNVFKKMAQFMIKRMKSLKGLIMVLLMLSFFLSMVITNDVALITFVPLTIVTLNICDKQKYIIYTVVLQTVFANLGSMLTPMGNPQNLYLYSYFKLSAMQFFSLTIPIIIVCFILLLVCVIPIKNESLKVKEVDNSKTNKKIALCYLLLGLISLLAVFSIIKWWIAVIIISLFMIIVDKKNFKNVDWFLLLTFICFFVFVGNVKNIQSVKYFLEKAIKGREFLSAIVLSQIISNVPCAVMLSGFTKNYSALILGTDIGGLGTPIASLASLIAFRLYAKYERAEKGKFLLFFSVVNLIFLLILIAFCSIMLYRFL